MKSEGDFDSEGESISSKLSAETDPGLDNLVDSTPAKRGTEVDLSGFHDVCRKILARPLPQGFKTGTSLNLCSSSLKDVLYFSMSV